MEDFDIEVRSQVKLNADELLDSPHGETGRTVQVPFIIILKYNVILYIYIYRPDFIQGRTILSTR